jgi:hypothetical protein
MGVFEIAPANPLKFIEPNTNRFDGTAAIDLINSFQEDRCYFQKWQRTDTSRLQILSDFSDITFEIIDLITGATALSVDPIDMESSIVGQSFKVYEFPLTFSLLEEGLYVGKISYTGEFQRIELYSEPMDVREHHEETILISYKNSENNFSIVFDTDITFHLRVEGLD